MNLPDFVVIGAVKAGTSSLHRFLNRHPSVRMSNPKELNFFIAERQWARGADWYASHFLSPTSGLMQGEASPQYTRGWQFAGVPQRMAGMIPDARLVYLVRDPLRRMISEYPHRISWNREARPIDEALLDAAVYDECSAYHDQVSRFLRSYRREQVHIAVAERLYADDAGEVERLCRFLGVDPAPFAGTPFDWVNAITTKRRRFRPVFELSRHPAYRAVAATIPAAVKQVFRKLTSTGIDDVVAVPRRETLIAVTARLADDVAALRRMCDDDFPEWTLLREMESVL